MTLDSIRLRDMREDDYSLFITRLDEWWGGRQMAAMLPRLFFVHFPDTSVVATDGDRPIGFLCGFQSGGNSDVAYIHFVGVDPAYRARGVGRLLYEWFFDRARRLGRNTVECVTSPVNERSLAFHRALGFSATPISDYDGPGEDRMKLVRQLA